MLVAIICLTSLATAWNPQDWDECTAHNDDCEHCLINPKCGFCGYFGSGWCIPGNANGSQIHPMTECPPQNWKYGDDGCVEHVRDVSWNKTDTKIEWKLITVSGKNFTDATVEAVIFSMALENNEDVVLAIGHGKGNADNLEFTFHAIAWDNFIEFEDKNHDGMWDPWTEWPRHIYNISQNGMKPIQYSNATENNVTLHRGSIETEDGIYKLICHVSNAEYVLREGGKIFSPFEMKCDIALHNYVRQNEDDLLAINTFIVSANAVFNASGNSTLKKCQMGNGEAFFDWEEFVELEDSNETAPIKVSDLKLEGAHFEWDPDTPVFTTIFTFLTSSGSWVWDPLVGIQTAPPVPQASSESSHQNSNSHNQNSNSNSNDQNSNSNNQGSGEANAGSSLFACVKIVAFIVALIVPLFILL